MISLLFEIKLKFFGTISTNYIQFFSVIVIIAHCNVVMLKRTSFHSHLPAYTPNSNEFVLSLPFTTK